MSLFLFLAGGAQIAFGVFAFATAPSSVQEQTAAICFGLGVLAIGLSAILDKPSR